MTEGRRDLEADDLIVSDHLAGLKGLDRISLRYGRFLLATRGATIKSSKAKVPTSADEVLKVLKNSTDWDTGLSSKNIASRVRYSQKTVQRSLKTLIKRGLVATDQKGAAVRYWRGR